MELLRYCAVLVIVSSAVYAEIQNGSCCAAGQYIFRSFNNTKECWDPILGRNLSLSIPCKAVAMLNEKLYGFALNDAGELSVIDESSGYKFELEAETFCIGNFTERTNGTTDLKTSRTAIVCVDEETPQVVDGAMAYCMIVSVVFLTLTAIIYAILPEVRDLQGKSIINFCISLALGLCCLAIMQLISSYSDMSLCAARGFLTYYFLIVSFFWTNAISIQILRSLSRPFIVDYGWREFGWYALYAWGSGSLLTIIMAIVNFHPGRHQKPGIGLNHCWFFDKKQQWYYMYSVMTILITANICIFIYTSVHLWRQRSASTHAKALKYKFFMTLKLFIIMGVTWIFEMISSFFPENTLWLIMDFVNVLVGPLLFLVLVVFRKRVVKALHKRGYLDCMSNIVERHLAVGEDDEGNVIEHTMDVAMDEKTVTDLRQ